MRLGEENKRKENYVHKRNGNETMVTDGNRIVGDHTVR